MVSSLDGFIAKRDGSVDWLHSTDSYDQGEVLSEEMITKVLAGIDCYVMGSRTYQDAERLGWPYGDIPVFVFSNRDLTTTRSNVSFLSGDIEKVLNEELRNNYKNIWLVGGSDLAKRFLKLDLVDEIIVSIMPVLLGDGVLFFDHIEREKRLHLKDSKAYSDGMVEITYEILK